MWGPASSGVLDAAPAATMATGDGAAVRTRTAGLRSVKAQGRRLLLARRAAATTGDGGLGFAHTEAGALQLFSTAARRGPTGWRWDGTCRSSSWAARRSQAAGPERRSGESNAELTGPAPGGASLEARETGSPRPWQEQLRGGVRVERRVRAVCLVMPLKCAVP